MRKYYTRPCNFYYGNQAKELIAKKKALSLTGNQDIAFDQLEIFQRISKGNIKSIFCKVNEIEKLDKEKTSVIKKDLKNIISKRKNILNLKFNNSHIMGVLNITPDSFSDGGKYLKSSVLIYRDDPKENYLIVCKNQTCSNKIKSLDELKLVVNNYEI